MEGGSQGTHMEGGRKGTHGERKQVRKTCGNGERGVRKQVWKLREERKEKRQQ